MRRRTMLKAGIGLASLPLLTRMGFADSRKPISLWYESASPENQSNLEHILVNGFNDSHQDEMLGLEFRGMDLDKQMRVAMLAGTGPDIVFTSGPSYVATMAQAGQLMSLDDYAAKYRWNETMLQVLLDVGRYAGKLYAVPKTYETLGLFYNKTIFQQNGWTAPRSIDELEKLAEDMKRNGIVPFGAGNADWRAANEWYLSIAFNSIAGPDNVYKALTGAIAWTDTVFQHAVDRLTAWWDRGFFGENYFSLTLEQGFAQIASGQAGMAPTGTWAFTDVQTYFPQNDAEPDFVGFPSLTGDPIYPLGVGSTLSINASTGNADGAASVLDYIFRADFYTRINSVWQGEWNLPIKDLTTVTLADTVSPLYTKTMKNLASAIAAGNYGYTSWTFLPPATDTYLVSGIEEVWLKKTTSTKFLEKLDVLFRQEKSSGKLPSIPPHT